MQPRPDFPLPLALVLCLALSASIHGKLAHAQDFNFSTGTLTAASFTSLKGGVVDSSGTLTLNATTEDAEALYASPVNLLNTISGSVHSFSSFFTFSANATTGNGTVAFVMVPNASQAGLLAAARSTFSVEFNTSCFTGAVNGSRSREGGEGGWGFYGGIQVLEYANDTLIAAAGVGGYGPNWDGNRADAPFFCSRQSPTNPSFQYQVVVEYNASTETVWVGSPSCGAALARTTNFAPKDLSTILSKPVYVGFVVTGGGIFELSQWSFTGNATTSSVASLALSSSVGTTAPARSSSDVRGGGDSDSKLGKRYVVAFSVLGAAVGVVAMAALCCLLGCRRRRRRTACRFGAKGVGTIPESKVMFDAAKPPMAPARMSAYERDTTPLNLNTRPTSTLHSSSSTGEVSWLQPVAPR